MNIPEGFNTVTPYFIVCDADAYVAFLVSAFDAKEIGRSLRPDGKVANAQVKIGTSILMIGEAPDKDSQMRGSYYLYVENADIAVEKAINHGAELKMPVSDMCYGDRQGGVIDPFGNIWWVSQRLVDEPYF
jgi:PhnB protein